MTVYVDDMKAAFGRMIMCHMIGDTEDELHRMAQAIGVARKWYQGDHYDVSLGCRAKAVKLGAAEITWREAGMMMACVRHKITQTLPLPWEAEALHGLSWEGSNPGFRA